MHYEKENFDRCGYRSENEIKYIGGGLTKDEAKAPKIIELGGKKIGVYNCCEHEFSWIDDYGIGANGFDPLESLEEIAELKAKCDYVIVLYHGGRENFRYPSPLLQKVCRSIARHGAYLIICQHTHCVGAMEEYRGSTIVYGQGNTLFDFASAENMPTWQTSILVEVTVENGVFTVDYIPIEKRGAFTALSNNSEILDSFFKRSKEILEEGFVKRNYTEFVMNSPKTFKEYFKFFSDADKLGTKHGAGTRNLLTCDPHREFITTYVEALHRLYKDASTQD